MTISNIELVELPAPENHPGIEQGLAKNGLDPALISSIGGILTLFSERQKEAPLSISAGADEILKVRSQEALTSAHIDRVTGFKDGTSYWADIDSYAKRLVGENPDKRSVVLLMCDLAGLKRVNDNYGDLVGDKYLREVATALETKTRPDDTWYRLGKRSDEFVAILHGVKPDSDGNYEQAIEVIIGKLEEEVEQHLILAGLPVEEQKLGIVIAGGLLKPNIGVKELFEEVDSRLAVRKRLSRNELPEHLKYDSRLEA